MLYRSDIEPFNSILTGKTGGDPGYDPLAFAIEECHKRGMECHAWMVTVPLGGKKHVASLGKQSVTKRERDICVPYKNEYFAIRKTPRAFRTVTTSAATAKDARWHNGAGTT